MTVLPAVGRAWRIPRELRVPVPASPAAGGRTVQRSKFGATASGCAFSRDTGMWPLVAGVADTDSHICGFLDHWMLDRGHWTVEAWVVGTPYEDGGPGSETGESTRSR